MVRRMVVKLAGAGLLSLSTSEVLEIVTKRVLPLINRIRSTKGMRVAGLYICI